MLFDVLGLFFVSTRPRFVTVDHLMVWCFTLFATLTASVSGEETYDLSVNQSANDSRLVRAVVEVTGDLKLNEDGKKVSKLPFRVRGDLQYSERTIDQTPTERRDVRYYQTAEAHIRVGEGSLNSGLSDTRRLVLAHATGSRHTIFSPQGAFTRDEFDLINIQGSTALTHLLPPAEPVAIDSEWRHDDKFVAAFLSLDAIAQSDVKSTLRNIEDHIAIIDMSGKVSGAVDGVSSDIVLKAKYNVDLKQHAVTWLAMSIREQRAIGHATPGFDVTARIRVAASNEETPPELTADALAGLPLEVSDGATLISLPSPAGGFSLLHARQWQVMVDRADMTILRMIEQGDLIAQCNVTSLPDLDRGKRVPLDAFRADVQKALGKNFGEFVEASQRTNDRGLRVLRAVVSGVASELPIQWIYYHLSDSDGRQAAIVFTMDSKVVEKFAGGDDALVSSFEFAERRRPTPASVEKKAVDASVR